MYGQVLALASLASTSALVNAVAIEPKFYTNDISRVGSQKDIYQFLYGSAPYFSYPFNTSIPVDIPEQCEMVQVHVYARHGERYPTASTAKGIEKVWYKFGNYTEKFSGSLSFLNDEYQFPFANASNWGLLTTPDNVINPYNPLLGSLTGSSHGEEFRERYSKLLDAHPNFTIWTSNSNRVHATSEFFIQGLGDDYHVNLETISENGTMGANSLTPISACVNWDWNTAKDKNISSTFSTQYLTDISERLNTANPGLNITNSETYNLFDWCAFEIDTRGYSDICDIFTEDELINYSYYGDLITYYDEFIGNKLAVAVGSVPTNATLTLLNTPEDELDQTVFVSFTHDTHLLQYMAGVGLFSEGKPLTGKSVDFHNEFKRSFLVQLGARVYTQKFNCKSASNTTESFVRYVVNDVVQPLDDCHNGPGFSCSLPDYNTYLKNRFEGVDFFSQCGVSQVSNTSELTFYWDYKTKNYDAPLII